nr:hypothetical protein MarQu_140 [Marseillevirus sp.]
MSLQNLCHCENAFLTRESRKVIEQEIERIVGWESELKRVAWATQSLNKNMNKVTELLKGTNAVQWDAFEGRFFAVSPFRGVEPGDFSANLFVEYDSHGGKMVVTSPNGEVTTYEDASLAVKRLLSDSEKRGNFTPCFC